jgi:hypothetical protein
LRIDACTKIYLCRMLTGIRQIDDSLGKLSGGFLFGLCYRQRASTASSPLPSFVLKTASQSPFPPNAAWHCSALC